MTHFANCMRSTLSSSEVSHFPRETLSSLAFVKGSSKLAMSATEITETKSEAVNSLRLDPSPSFVARVPLISKYQLWPRRTHQHSPSSAMEPIMPNPQNRSPSSLSDTSVPSGRGGLWIRGGSLARRRKISVPELRQKGSLELPSQPLIDSPTLPGMIPMSSVDELTARHSRHSRHSRSSSFPDDQWTNSSLGDAAIQDACDLSFEMPQSPVTQWPLKIAQPEWTTFNPTRPLSPIFSPPESTTPTTSVAGEDMKELPPRVPPKTPVAEQSVSPTRNVLRKPQSKPSFEKLPTKQMMGAAVTTPPAALLTPTTASPSLKIENKISPTRRTITGSPKTLTSISMTVPIVERGRPPVCTKAKRHGMIKDREESLDEAKLPVGLRPTEAAIMLPEGEKDTIRQQACSQAERFEILGARHVHNLSKELRTLDERCEYLRKTYKGLRAGRQKLHSRMISYLKSDALIFSKDRLLRQEEALLELDKSIDDWTLKLERAENRRLRVRQKLLEHVAAAMTLNLPSNQPGHGLQSTPPGSPPRLGSPEPLRVERKDVESIKIYADTQVLNLFTDIEQAIGRMCEAC